MSIPSISRDVRDLEPEDFDGIEAVVHLANLSNDPLGNLDPDLTYEINHRASVHLARLARVAGVKRFVFASSCSLYGSAGADLVNETAAFNPATAYGAAKVLAERDIAPLACDTFSPVFLRNATVYGVSPRLRFDLVVNNLTAWAMATGEVKMKSDGSALRPLVHVADVCEAVRLALEAPRELIHNEAFNVGATSENYRIRDVAALVSAEVPGTIVTCTSNAPPDERSYRVDFSKIKERLGFEVTFLLADGVRELRDALKDADIGPGQFEGVAFQRIARLQSLMNSGQVRPDLRPAAPLAIAA